MAAAGDGLAALLRGDDETEETIAASRLLVETLALARGYFSGGKIK